MARPKKEKDDIIEDSMGDIFADLNKEANGYIPEAAHALGEQDINAETTQFISTGSYVLDTLISNRKDKGGFPVGRITEVVGFESSGKSLLGIHACRDTQAKGGIPIYLDIEKAMDFPHMANMGVDIKKIHYTRKLVTVEQVIEYNEMIIKKIIDKQLQHKKKNRDIITVVWDSLASTTTQEVLEAEVGARMYPRLAMILSTRLPQIVDLLDDANVCMIVLNQLREKPGVLFGDNKYSPGGNAMKFYASLRLFLTRGAKIIANKGRPNESVIGNNTTIETRKNKISAPFRKAKVDLYFNRGISDVSGSLDILMKNNEIVYRPSKTTQELVLASGETIPFKLAEWGKLYTQHKEYITEKTKEALLIDLRNPDLMETREDDEEVSNVDNVDTDDTNAYDSSDGE